MTPFGRVTWGWTTEFALYQSFNTAIGFIGTIIVTGFFVNYLKLVDPFLVIIAVGCRLISRILYTISKDFYMIYLAGGIDMFNSAPVIAIRSLISKIVANNEIGRAYTVLSVLETLIQPVSVITYSQIFQDTIQTVPAAFFYLTIGILIVVILLFL